MNNHRDQNNNFCISNRSIDLGDSKISPQLQEEQSIGNKTSDFNNNSNIKFVDRRKSPTIYENSRVTCNQSFSVGNRRNIDTSKSCNIKDGTLKRNSNTKNNIGKNRSQNENSRQNGG